MLQAALMLKAQLEYLRDNRRKVGGCSSRLLPSSAGVTLLVAAGDKGERPRMCECGGAWGAFDVPGCFAPTH